MSNNLLKQCFFKWLEFHIKNINKRHFIINATIFRYKYLFKKTMNSIKKIKNYDINIRLKKLVFQGLINMLQEKEQLMKKLQFQKTKKIFLKWKSITVEIQKQKEVDLAIKDCYNQKLIVKTFVKFKKAIKIIKKRKQNSKIIINKKKCQYFDKWILRLQDINLHKQLLQDSSQYYREILLKKVFQRWKKYIAEQLIYNQQSDQMKKIIKAWIQITKEESLKRQAKYQPIHNKWRKYTFFIQWKKLTLDQQRERLANDFYKYKIIQGWRNYVQHEKQKELKLQDKELQLTLMHMIYLKQQVLYKWIQKHQYKIDRKGLVKMLLQTKQKQNRLKFLIKGLRSLHLNLLLNKHTKRKLNKLQNQIFQAFKTLYKLHQTKMNSFIQYQLLKKNQKLKIIFDEFNSQYQIFKKKKLNAIEFYEKRLLKEYFSFFMFGIINEYKQLQKLSNSFYKKRRLFFIFQRLKQNTQLQKKRKINQAKVVYFSQQIQKNQLRKVFYKFKATLLSNCKGKKKLLQLQYNVFYQWRIAIKLLQIQRK